MDYEIKEVINKNNKGKVSCNRDFAFYRKLSEQRNCWGFFS